jgi:Arc/MetJ family transcription regulator
MPKQKTTIYLDSDILAATKAAALTSHRTESAVVEDALRHYLTGARSKAMKDELGDLLDRVAGRSDLDEDAALQIAVDEVHAVRRQRRIR